MQFHRESRHRQAIRGRSVNRDRRALVADARFVTVVARLITFSKNWSRRCIVRSRRVGRVGNDAGESNNQKNPSHVAEETYCRRHARCSVFFRSAVRGEKGTYRLNRAGATAAPRGRAEDACFSGRVTARGRSRSVDAQQRGACVEPRGPRASFCAGANVLASVYRAQLSRRGRR